MNVHASVHASVTHIMINHKYWPILSYNNSHNTGIILEQFYKWMSGRLRFIVGDTSELKSRHTCLCAENTQAIRLFRIISIPSKFGYFRPPDHMILIDCSALNFRCQCTQQKLQSICAVLTFDPELKKILTFSVKDRYQLNYLICIKDFNA
jgi:hypothetical protein